MNMKRFLNIAMLMLFVTSIQAQKIDARLTNLLTDANGTSRAKSAVRSQQVVDTAAVKSEINVHFNSDCSVRSFRVIAMLKEDAECPAALLQKLNISIFMQVGRMLILDVPAESLLALDDIDEIESVGADQVNQIMNAHGREKSRVTEVATLENAISHNLPQAYTGKGVLVGIIDTGIDFNHAAFRNADGSSRVKLALVTLDDGTHVYTDPVSIAALTSDEGPTSHGTHVGGVAVGSNVVGKDGTTMIGLQGMAPEATLMLHGMDVFYDSNVVYGMKTMFDYAKEQGMPCVINMSFGNIRGFHDGISSAEVNFLREYYKTEGNAKGNICVMSIGNNADVHAALYNVLPAADSEGYNLKTILGETGRRIYDSKSVNYYTNIDNFFYNQDGSEICVDVFVVDVTTGQRYTLAEKPLYSVHDGAPQTELRKVAAKNLRNNKYYVNYSLSSIFMFHEPNLKLAYYVKSAAGKTLRAMDGRLDSTAGFHSYNMEGFADGQDNGAFNADVCGEEVITVGAYYSATSFVTIEGKKRSTDPTLENTITSFSSWGTDDNGINYPDVVAPGAVVVSAYNIYDLNYFDEGTMVEGSENNLVAGTNLFNRNHYYGIEGGTSMSSPNVTGIIALWLQANPELTYADVRSLIKETSYNDEYTTNIEKIPSRNVMQAGAGKIDALAGLQKLVGTTDIKVVDATGQRHATPATMYDIDDNCYNPLGQRVSKNAKGLIIYKGKVYLNR